MADTSTKNNKHFESIPYYALATDPIHIGTGGFRLGRVDNTIVRDPPTQVPKLPGSGLAGVVRAYSAIAHNKYLFEQGGKLRSCAGKGGEKGEQHCGEPNCPICTTFGFSKGTAKTSFQGLAQFFDAEIIFFPVRSMIGPIWVTCASVLKGLTDPELSNCAKEKFVPLGNDNNNPLNFGWLLLQNETKKSVTFKFPTNVVNKLKSITERLFQVEDSIFCNIVNDNLEVRTSVAIDPKTGASESGALFTYEAIPAGTVFAFDVVINNPANFRIYDTNSQPQLIKHNSADATIQSTQEIVEKGLNLIEFLGLGGMGTRGFGRMKILNFEQGGKNDKPTK